MSSLRTRLGHCFYARNKRGVSGKTTGSPPDSTKKRKSLPNGDTDGRSQRTSGSNRLYEMRRNTRRFKAIFQAGLARASYLRAYGGRHPYEAPAGPASWHHSTTCHTRTLHNRKRHPPKGVRCRRYEDTAAIRLRKRAKNHERHQKTPRCESGLVQARSGLDLNATGFFPCDEREKAAPAALRTAEQSRNRGAFVPSHMNGMVRKKQEHHAKDSQ